LKKVKVVKVKEIEIKPFIISDFTHNRASLERIETVSKKVLKKLAKEIGLEYSDEQIQFTKKLIDVYLAKR
jgi:hypothetical protein